MGEGGAGPLQTHLRLKGLWSPPRVGEDCWCHTGCDNTCKRFNWKFKDLPYGYDHKYVYSSLGYNLKITDMQASIELAQLDKLKNFIK